MKWFEIKIKHVIQIIENLALQEIIPGCRKPQENDAYLGYNHNARSLCAAWNWL